MKSITSSQDPGSVLWRIETSNEGVLEFSHSPLPESAYLPEIINFTFPMEVMTYSHPTLDNSGPKLLKFNHNKGRLAFCNPIGDPPTQNPPSNETRIRHHRLLSNRSTEFQEGIQQCEGQYRHAPPPIKHSLGGFQRQAGSGDARMYDPT